jgi:hypothetical protein
MKLIFFYLIHAPNVANSCNSIKELSYRYYI